MENTNVKSVKVTVGDDGVVLVTLAAKNGQYLEETNGLTAPVLYAVSDFVIGRYDHPLTTVGLHVYRETDLAAFEVTNAAVVHWRYAGTTWPVPTPDQPNYRDKKANKNSWAQINVRNGDPWLQQFTEKIVQGRPQGAIGKRIRKHDYIDAILQGYGFKITVQPSRSAILQHELDVIAAFEKKGYEAAMEIRNTSIGNARIRDEHYFQTVDLLKKQNGNGHNGNGNGDLKLTVFGVTPETQISVGDLQNGTEYSWVPKGQKQALPQRRTWKGTPFDVASFATAIENQWQIKLHS